MDDNTPVLRAVCGRCGQRSGWYDYPKDGRFSARFKAVENLRDEKYNPPPGEKGK